MAAATISISSGNPPQAAQLSDGRKLAIFAIMAFGNFMALLDTQIVAASLNSIRPGFRPGRTRSPGCRPPI